jgi:tetratricopeptide (TPR) repeat protein
MKRSSPTVVKAAKGVSGSAMPEQRQAAEEKKGTVLQTTVHPGSSQSESFESAMKLFHSRDFAGALELFEKAAQGPSREMAHTAKVHARMCAQRLGKLIPELRGVEDVYHYVTGLISQRKLSEAEKQLRQVMDGSEDKDFLHYAMSLVRGLQGDLSGAAKHMEQAIRLDPKNRMIARTDQDFLEFGRHSPLRELVFGEKKESV